MSDILLSGEDRRQELFLPKMLDDYVEEDNYVRFIEAFVNWLNMKALGFKHAEPSGGAGRAPYDPRPMLMLFIWGYLNGVRSSRKLETECLLSVEELQSGLYHAAKKDKGRRFYSLKDKIYRTDVLKPMFDTLLIFVLRVVNSRLHSV